MVNIRLDMKKYEATIEERALDLTPTEFRLLAALVRRQGEVAAEQELLQEVWGEARPEDPSLVRRYVLMLRKKLETDPPRPRVLLTVQRIWIPLGHRPPA